MRTNTAKTYGDTEDERQRQRFDDLRDFCLCVAVRFLWNIDFAMFIPYEGTSEDLQAPWAGQKTKRCKRTTHMLKIVGR